MRLSRKIEALFGGTRTLPYWNQVNAEALKKKEPHVLLGFPETGIRYTVGVLHADTQETSVLKPYLAQSYFNAHWFNCLRFGDTHKFEKALSSLDLLIILATQEFMRPGLSTDVVWILKREAPKLRVITLRTCELSEHMELESNIRSYETLDVSETGWHHVPLFVQATLLQR